MKFILIIPLILISGLVFADVNPGNKIKTADRNRAMASLSSLAGKTMYIGNGDISVNVVFGYAPQTENDNQFTKRVIATLTNALIKLGELNIDAVDKVNQRNAIPPPSVSTPDLVE